MSYIGVPPQATFSSGLLDRFTSTTGTTVTLTHDIASENDIVVFVNFVKQDSTTYSVGGTGNKTLTLGGTLVSSDIVEVHYLNIVGQTNAPSSGSVGSSQLSADIITGQTALAVAPDSTDELLISDGGTLKRIDVSLVGGTNTPAFFATLSSNQSVTSATTTKVQFDTEVVDTDSNYDNSSNYRFTPTTAGKYFVFVQVESNFSGGYGDDFQCFIYKNGSQHLRGRFSLQVATDNGFYNSILVNGIVDMNGSSDYLEGFGRYDGSSPFFSGGDYRSYFGAYKLIGV